MALKKYGPNASQVAVLFASATWCPHCRNAKPELRKAADILGSVVPVYEVDSERDAATIKALGVRGFPTIFFRDASGKLTTYRGERTGRDIADWVCTVSGKCGRR